jgi:hypothetical protein
MTGFCKRNIQRFTGFDDKPLRKHAVTLYLNLFILAIRLFNVEEEKFLDRFARQ